MSIKSTIVVMPVLMLMVMACCRVAAAAAPPEHLTLSDLINHPERLPTHVTLTRTLRFTNGLTLAKGQKYLAVGFDGKTVTIAYKHTDYSLNPSETNLLAAANAQWEKLVPAQRAVTAKTLAADASLWPAKIKVLESVTFKGTRFPADTAFTLATFGPKGAVIYSTSNDGGLTGVRLSDTDLLAQARKLATIPRDKRPSRIIEELRGKLVNADGTPAKLDFDKIKYFAIYYGADWCVWCHKLSPHMVKVMNEIGPRNPHLAFVMIDDDDNPADMLKYMNEVKMPWPAMTKADSLKTGVLRSMRHLDPQLRILDRYGNELYSGTGGNPQEVKADVDALVAFDKSGKGR